MVRSMVVAAIESVRCVFVAMMVEYEVVGSPDLEENSCPLG